MSPPILINRLHVFIFKRTLQQAPHYYAAHVRLLRHPERIGAIKAHPMAPRRRGTFIYAPQPTRVGYFGIPSFFRNKLRCSAPRDVDLPPPQPQSLIPHLVIKCKNSNRAVAGDSFTIFTSCQIFPSNKVVRTEPYGSFASRHVQIFQALPTSAAFGSPS